VSGCADLEQRLTHLLMQDEQRTAIIQQVAALNLPDCWLSAGFIRDAVWDAAHGSGPAIRGDVDVIWHSGASGSAAMDQSLERQLATGMPDVDWSVKDQARMHSRNGDAPYASCAEAMRHWPETATAVAVRQRPDGTLAICAPFGLADLFALHLRPAGAFADAKRAIFDERVKAKAWLARYPSLTLLPF